MQILYFPFLNMENRQEIDFGFLKIWNFDIMSTTYITDTNLLSRVSKIMETNHAYFTGPLRGIGLVSIGDTDFHTFNQDELELIKDARLVLFISFIGKNNLMRVGPNAVHWYATTENFLPKLQNFNVDDDNMAVFDGYIVQSMAGGYRMGEHIFYRPSYVPAPINFDIDEELFNYLLLIRAKKPRVFSRIVSAIELFSESYYNSYSLSNNARILCQMGAFEMLLDLPEKQQRKVFKDRVEAETSDATEKRYAYFYEVKAGKKKKERRTLKGIWADKFYTLRNHVIHGLKINNDQYVFKKSQRHIDVALIFFIFLVKSQINRSLRKRVFTQRIDWEEQTDPYSGNSWHIFRYYPI